MLGNFLPLRKILDRLQKIENAALSTATEYDFPLCLIASRNQAHQEIHLSCRKNILTSDEKL